MRIMCIEEKRDFTENAVLGRVDYTHARTHARTHTYIYIQGVQKVPVRLNIFSGKIIITEVKIISEVTLTRNSMVTFNLT